MTRRQAAASRRRGPPTVKETTVTQLLEDARVTDFKNADDVGRFQETHRTRLDKDPNLPLRYKDDEVLNEIARGKNIGPFKGFVKWAVQNHRALLLCKSDGGYTPLHLAIRSNNNEFVGLLLQFASNVQELLSMKCDLSMTCLHFAIENRSPFTEEIIARALQSTGKGATAIGTESSRPYDIFTVQSTDPDPDTQYEGMTPLHIAAVSELYDRRDDAFLSHSAPSMPNAKFQDNSKNRSTGATSSRDREITRDWEVTRNRESGRDRDPDRHLLANTRLQRTTTFDMDKGLAVPVQKGSVGARERDAQKGDAELLRSARRFDLLEIVKKLVDANPRVLVDYKDATSCTPFQALMEDQYDAKKTEFSKLKTAAEREAKRHEMIEKDPILEYLRAYIIDKFNRRDAMQALYKVGEERVLELDLFGLPYSTIDAEFLHGLGKVLRFEGLLKYVALPRLTVRDEDGEFSNPVSRKKADDEQAVKLSGSGAGLQNMCTIFNWLRKNHVKSVLKVSVVDDLEPSHSDEAIEQCLGPIKTTDSNTVVSKGLDVRIWNWFKIDLCIDVIQNSAPNVRDVTLYSSGNNAVLVGWSSDVGLPRLQKLERVYVYVHEGLERRSRLDEYMSMFEQELLRRIPGIACSWELLKSDSSYNSVFFDKGVEQETESRWMRTMKDYAQFLAGVKPDNKVPPVKIAIIDDGIDTSLDDFTDKIQVGESFYRLSEMFGRRGSYYVPTGKHGTLMAQSICSVCPMVKLYIAQLEVLPNQNGQRSFTSESATEAILWAVGQGVDIISMSWSISGRELLGNLEDALRMASQQNILMFCASIDEGASAIDTTYPGKTNLCIKIGASTGTGAKLSWVSGSNSNFLLPGETPLQKMTGSGRWNPNQHQSLPSMGLFGSSVSTALAAGLAGVLIYTDRLLSSESRSDVLSSEDTTAGFGLPTTINSASIVATGTGGDIGTNGGNEGGMEYLRTTHKMYEAFEFLSKGTEGNKFPQIWDHLPKNIKSLVWNKKALPDETAQTINELKNFMKYVKR